MKSQKEHIEQQSNRKEQIDKAIYKLALLAYKAYLNELQKQKAKDKHDE